MIFVNRKTQLARHIPREVSSVKRTLFTFSTPSTKFSVNVVITPTLYLSKRRLKYLLLRLLWSYDKKTEDPLFNCPSISDSNNQITPNKQSKTLLFSTEHNSQH